MGRVKVSKKLKDSVYGYIEIRDDYVTHIIDTAIFQRLRRIMQTSYGPLYASAVHNRFTHSLGVFHLGTIASDALIHELKEKYQTEISDFDVNIEHIQEIFLLACLLHDVGHAPFSHTGEDFYLEKTKDHRYDVIHRILRETVSSDSFSKDVPSSDFGAAAPHEVMSAIVGLREFSAYFTSAEDRELFARCITGYQYSEKGLLFSLYNCFVSLLNSKVIDVDRLDYLIRDAFFTGFDTVRIDYRRLLEALTVIKSDTRDDLEESPKFELAYRKGAISVIENVVYAHDAERKWIQTHPVVLYDIYILRHIMTRLDQSLSIDEQKLFSVESLGTEGAILNKGVCIRLFCDDDVISLMKNGDWDSLSKEYFDRVNRRRPLWKSEPEYIAFMKHDVTGGKLLEKIWRALKETEAYLTRSSDDWIINDEAISKIEEELEKAQEGLKQVGENDISKQKSISVQIKSKKSVLMVMKCLKRFSEEHELPSFSCVVLSASQFNSGFNKPDVSEINLVFHDGKNDRVKKLKEVLKPLNGETPSQDKFFYFYFYRKQLSPGEINESDLKAALAHALMREFISEDD